LTEAGAPAAGLIHHPEFRQGLRDMAPFGLGLVPVALAVGALAVENGLSWWLAALLSALVYAGPTQLLALQLLGLGAGTGTIVAASALSNLRYALYGLTLAPHLEGVSRRRVLGLTFILADGVFALTMRRIFESPGVRGRDAYILASVPLVVVPWTVLTIAGALAATQLPNLGEWGLAFATPAIFLALLVPLLRRRIDFLVMVLAGGAATAGVVLLPSGLGVVVAILAGAGLGTVLEWRR
jgi:predicted branched-subunit amino acid permease